MKKFVGVRPSAAVMDLVASLLEAGVGVDLMIERSGPGPVGVLVVYAGRHSSSIAWDRIDSMTAEEALSSAMETVESMRSCCGTDSDEIPPPPPAPRRPGFIARAVGRLLRGG